ncbi:MAG: RNA-binding S4 domain-containing protein [Proteobacteria bacterium]|nr:RNA-binding S4 domain-containing protein [Pseudomonadota bacterium]
MTVQSQRLDKWLWYARFFKSRSLASKFCASGKLRINGTVNKKAHHAVHAGDVLTFPKGDHIRVIRINDLGARRGPATEAQTLYEDLQPPQPRKKSGPGPMKPAQREPGSGRPTKRQRRDTDRLRGE